MDALVSTLIARLVLVLAVWAIYVGSKMLATNWSKYGSDIIEVLVALICFTPF